MDIVSGLPGLKSIPRNAVMIVGNFDGVHLGHRRLLDYGRQIAGAGDITLVTFEPHPLAILRPDLAPPRLTPREMKHRLLAEAGVNVLVELPPDPAVLSIQARAFFDLLVNDLHVAHLVEGPDFNFGKGREGNITNLKRWAEGTSLQVHVVEELSRPLTNLHLVEVRSSMIRWLVAYGRVRDAAICLGRPYTLRGRIVEGFKRGRQLGMPTANFDCGEQFVPADGVYVGRCVVEGKTYAAGVSIGTLPTFGETKRQVEAHLLGFDGDLYGQVMEVELLDYLREQRKFTSLDELKKKMRADMRICQALVTMDPARPVVSVA
jgi:riboflavin kinase/FMN adenylyltransferase